MERNPVILSASQCGALESIITSLVGQYAVEYIICFGCVNESKAASSCFVAGNQQSNTHYFLLVITTDNTRREHDIQCFVNDHFDKGSITVLAHGLETINSAITQGNRFFGITCRDGMQLYSSNGLRFNREYPNLSPATTLASAEKHFTHRYEMAIGFLDAAEESMSGESYAIAVFMLHQAVEQACIAMIRVYLHYRVDIHQLSRLLNLCRCFSEEPVALFPKKTAEGKRLFTLLLNSYSEARYSDSFKVNGGDAFTLSVQVRALIELTERLCTERIRILRSAVPEVKEIESLNLQPNDQNHGS